MPLQVAATDSDVLISGETGTDKELAAELIHRNSPRHDKPFICINCAALPEGLLESELFGFYRGAFAVSNCAYSGKLKLAEGGTVFFDEIGDMSPYAQAKILRVIESKERFRLGGKGRIPLDIRIITATSQDLDNLVLENRFRKDLQHRRNMVRIHLPPLRVREEDIPALLDFCVRDLDRKSGRRVEGFAEEAIACLMSYEWPGNVREFKNMV